MKDTVSERRARLNSFCDKHPEMESRFEEIMDLMESSGDEIGSIDEAEDRIIEMSRGLNAQMLSGWCQRQERLVSRSQSLDPGLRSAGKKNFGGTPRSGRS